MDKNGVVKKREKKPEEYYEEYITVLGDAIKNGEIKKSHEVGRKVGHVIYPMLKKTHPNYIDLI